MRTPEDLLTEFSTRTVAEIQRHVIKRGKRNAISRRYHAKDDKDAIATWRLNLDGILHVFNVRSITSGRPLLISRSQTELVMDTHPTVSDIHHGIANIRTIVSYTRHDAVDADNIVPNVRNGVPNTHPIGSEVRSDIVNTRNTASDIRRDKLKSRRDVDGQKQIVSITHILTVTE